jgi:hypothetical protein
MKTIQRRTRSYHAVQVRSVSAVIANFSAHSSLAKRPRLEVTLVPGQKVTGAKVTLSHEVGPTLDSLLDRVGLDRVRHTDGGTHRPGRESTPIGGGPILGAAGGSDPGHASIPTRLVQTNRSVDHHADDDHDNATDHYHDEAGDDDFYSHDDHDNATDHYHDEAGEDKTCQSNQTPKGNVPLAISFVAGRP